MSGVLTGPVRIIGTGLLGGSIGLALRQAGIAVQVADISPTAINLAVDLGAGEPVTPESPEPQLVVVATPPDVAGATVRAALDACPHAVITDVASVKVTVAQEVEGHPQAHRYVGSHPMAGRETAGVISADADLFHGRPWVIVPNETAAQTDAVALLHSLALAVGATPVQMGAAEHDAAVAAVSHVPQVVSSLLAGTLRSTPETALALAGQGLRDVTRIAWSDPMLWIAILAANRTAVANVLRPMKAQLSSLLAALEGPTTSGVARAIAAVMEDGNLGVARIPGKHGGAPQRYEHVMVLVPDEPGKLGRLFTEIGDIGVNIEDFSLEHSVGQPVGRARISVQPAVAAMLDRELTARGWQTLFSRKEHSMSTLIAIDGPSGSGKSTVAKEVARRLGLAYLDTGSMYRAAAWNAQQQGIDLHDEAAVTAATTAMDLAQPLDPDDQTLICAGTDITAAIREPALSKVVSLVAVNLDVRAELKRRQQAIIATEMTSNGWASGRGIVLEGRDTTSVIAPEAPVKIILTASEEARLARRALEVRGSADAATIAATRDEVVRRDQQDSTVSSFMSEREGVTMIDSSSLTIEQVVETIIGLVSASDQAGTSAPATASDPTEGTR